MLWSRGIWDVFLFPMAIKVPAGNILPASSLSGIERTIDGFAITPRWRHHKFPGTGLFCQEAGRSGLDEHPKVFPYVHRFSGTTFVWKKREDRSYGTMKCDLCRPYSSFYLTIFPYCNQFWFSSFQVFSACNCVWPPRVSSQQHLQVLVLLHQGKDASISIQDLRLPEVFLRDSSFCLPMPESSVAFRSDAMTGGTSST